MRHMSVLVTSLASCTLMLLNPAPAAAVGTSQSGARSASAVEDLCRVRVSRTAAAGAFSLGRQVLQNGKCVCVVTTGPRSQGGAAESAIASLLLRRTCANAPMVSSGAVGNSGLAPIISGASLVAGGTAAAVASQKSDSP